MGRRAKVDTPVLWQAKIPNSVKVAVFTRLHNKVLGKIPHGRIGELTTNLLTAWYTVEGLLDICASLKRYKYEHQNWAKCTQELQSVLDTWPKNQPRITTVFQRIKEETLDE